MAPLKKKTAAKKSESSRRKGKSLGATKKKAVKKAAVKSRVKAKAKTVKKPVAAKKASKPKVSKKKTTQPKKVTAKKVVRKKTLPVAEGEYRFWIIYDGPVLASLRDLAVLVPKISKEQFEFHAYGDQNDFALWVRHVLRDAACAREIEKAATRRAVKVCVDRALIRYK